MSTGTVVAGLAPLSETLWCEGCHGVFTRQVARGRKPRWCPSCYESDCDWCDDTFELESPSREQRFCSRECLGRWQTEQARPESTCRVCGDTFRPKRSDRTGDYCSRSCAFKDQPRWACWSTALVPRRYDPAVGRGPATQLEWRDCQWCESQFISRNGRRYCSDGCQYEKMLADNRERYDGILPREEQCGRCGDSYTREYSNHLYCVECAGALRGERKRREIWRYKARKRDAFVEDVDLATLGERDGWMCGICGERVDVSLEYPDPRSPSIDHVVPLSRGGEHSLRNTQVAHWACNTEKADGSAGEQLRCVG